MLIQKYRWRNTLIWATAYVLLRYKRHNYIKMKSPVNLVWLLESAVSSIVIRTNKVLLFPLRNRKNTLSFLLFHSQKEPHCDVFDRPYCQNRELLIVEIKTHLSWWCVHIQVKPNGKETSMNILIWKMRFFVQTFSEGLR